MVYRFLLLLLVIGSGANAQRTSNPEVFAKTITANDLKKHLTVIAGAEMEGRNTPSPGLEKAADYITAQFKAFGLKAGNNGSFRQTYLLRKDSVAQINLNINGKEYTAYTDYAPYFFQNDKVHFTFNEFVFAGYGIVDDNRDDYKNLDVKDKLVVIVNGAPKDFTSSKTGRLSPTFIGNKIRAAQEKGAKAILVATEILPARGSGRSAYRPQTATGQPNAFATTPVFYVNENIVEDVSGGNLQTVLSALDNGSAPLGMQKANVVMDYETAASTAEASNVIGIVEGSDKKDEYVIITAHYDHVGKDAKGNIFYGADDDGSGTVSVIEMAEAFAQAKKAGKGPRRTVIFMTVSGEEKGLWGSEYYASHPIFPLDKTSVDLNIDIIGRTGTVYLNDVDAENYVFVIGDDKLSTDLAPITDEANAKYAKLKLDRRYNGDDPERFYYRSDHFNFAKNGVPAIFYFDGVHADYHQLTDTVDKINFSLMEKRARLVFYTAWEMANRNDMVKRDLELPAAVR
jgi:Zn-dependent M28 family amino/carboxypeptidase